MNKEDNKSMVEEALDWLRERKDGVETEIAYSIQESLKRFKDSCGVSVTSVYVNVIAIDEIGKPPRFEVAGVSVELDL